jgi:hypothetical protein
VISSKANLAHHPFPCKLPFPGTKNRPLGSKIQNSRLHHWLTRSQAPTVRDGVLSLYSEPSILFSDRNTNAGGKRATVSPDTLCPGHTAWIVKRFWQRVNSGEGRCQASGYGHQKRVLLNPVARGLYPLAVVPRMEHHVHCELELALGLTSNKEERS